jgi:hypothetical protein
VNKSSEFYRAGNFVSPLKFLLRKILLENKKVGENMDENSTIMLLNI